MSYDVPLRLHGKPFTWHFYINFLRFAKKKTKSVFITVSCKCIATEIRDICTCIHKNPFLLLIIICRRGRRDGLEMRWHRGMWKNLSNDSRVRTTGWTLCCRQHKSWVKAVIVLWWMICLCKAMASAIILGYLLSECRLIHPSVLRVTSQSNVVHSLETREDGYGSGTEWTKEEESVLRFFDWWLTLICCLWLKSGGMR